MLATKLGHGDHGGAPPGREPGVSDGFWILGVRDEVQLEVVSAAWEGGLAVADDDLAVSKVELVGVFDAVIRVASVSPETG
jgi:hypothetical protein